MRIGIRAPLRIDADGPTRNGDGRGWAVLALEKTRPLYRSPSYLEVSGRG